MKSRYKREAWLLDDGILLHGYKDKRGFHPEYGLQCGFGTEITKKRDVNKILFYSFKKAKEILGNIEVAGGIALIGIDDGMAATKVYLRIGDFIAPYSTETLITKENSADDTCAVIKELLKKINIVPSGIQVKYCLSSENKIFMTHLPPTCKSPIQVMHTTVIHDGYA